MKHDLGRSTSSALKLALSAQRLRGEFQDVDLLRSDPVAIIGMGCRFPGGADSPGAFWRNLVKGVDAIREVPEDRWDSEAYYNPDHTAPGKMNTRWGGFLDGIDQFDPLFFGISPREAVAMDPQQRLLLEVTWEALNDAGRPPESVAGSDTGVFTAIYYNDYARMQFANPSQIDAHCISGTLHCVAAGRVSYLLDLKGPSIAIDTGCSASLVALHLACQSLRGAECSMAIAGAANLMLTPEPTISLAKWGMLASDGRCKAFDESADGFSRGEGCGAVVLKRLSDALRDGDRVLAVIRGTAVNQDGQSAVLTSPNGPSQEEVIRAALDNARVSPDQISYIEAHGTGTKVGDPIEIEALKAVIGQGEKPCYLGSVKTHVGHLEAAAGMAGLIRSVLSLRHEYIPPHLHFTKLNPLITLDDSRLRLEPQGVSWPRGDVPRLAGISSFGIGGTNAHIVVEEAPQLPLPALDACRPLILPYSTAAPETLATYGEDLAAFLEADLPPEARPADVCRTAACHRTHRRYRRAVTGRTVKDLAAGLKEARPRVQAVTRPKVAFVFSGQGAQWVGMGRQLLAEEPSFAQTMDAIDREFQPLAGWSIREALLADDPDLNDRLKRTDVVQPLLFAMQMGLAGLWKSWGVEPAGVAGHSIGEIAAACVAGILSLPQAVEVVWRRSRLMQECCEGAMAAVGMSESDVRMVLEGREASLSIAAINSPGSVTVSGGDRAIKDLQSRVESQGAFFRRLEVSGAFHSAAMDPAAEALEKELDALQPGGGQAAFYSTVEGAVTDGAALNARYWRRNVRETVRFSPTIEQMARDGYNVLLEIAPHPVLAVNLAQILETARPSSAVLGSTRRGQDERLGMYESAAALFGAGVDVDWTALTDPAGRVVSLPAMPWKKARYWIPDPKEKVRAPDLDDHSLWHPLLGRKAHAPKSVGVFFEQRLPDGAPQYLRDHVIQGRRILPASAMVKMALAAGRALHGEEAKLALVNMEFLRPLPLGPKPVIVSTALREAGPDEATVEIHARPDEPLAGWEDGARHWVLFCRGTLKKIDQASQIPDLNTLERIRHRCRQPMDVGAFYHTVAESGLQFGPRFRLIQQLWRRGSEVAALIHLGSMAPDEERLRLHPALLDASFQPLNALVTPLEGSWLPLTLRRFEMLAPGQPVLWSSVELIKEDTSGGTAEVRVTAFTEEGQPLWTAEGLGLKLVPADSVAEALEAFVEEDLLYETIWREIDSPAGLPLAARHWLILAREKKQAQEFIQAMTPVIEIDAVPAAMDVLDELPVDRAVVVLAHTFAGEGLKASLEPACCETLRVLQWASRHQVKSPLVFVTAGAQFAPGQEAEPVPPQSAVWGLVKTASLENPQLTARLIDMAPDGAWSEESLREILSANRPRLLLLRKGRPMAPRLEPRRARFENGRDDAKRAYALVSSEEGVIDGIRHQAIEMPEAGPGEVVVENQALGLNFRDVLTVLRMLPDATGALGAECAGRVAAVGPGVKEVKPGDRVMAFGLGAMRSHVRLPAANVVKLPKHLSKEQGASIPVVFLTAWHAFKHLANVQPGQRVLIHSAAGGVGLAAVQVARKLGAEIFATAGSDDRRAYLRSIGLKHVFDSRSLAFASGIREATSGEGVDVVLNSLTGEFIPAGLQLLRPGGKFIEIGKREILTREQVDAVAPLVGYDAFDMALIAQWQPTFFHAMFTEITDMFDREELQPLPTLALPVDNASEGFRRMSQTRHIGKIVFRIEPARQSVEIDSKGAYLITGGLGALGQHVARWLIDHGARHVVLVSRHEPSGEKARALESLRRLPAQVHAIRADVADGRALAAALAALRDLPPLRGIVHAAGVLDDGIVDHLSWERFAPLMAAKVLGAANLCDLAEKQPLDFMVFFSSAAAVFGWPGQGNYAAANAAMDALAYWRCGQPDLRVASLNWGPWAGEGMAGSVKSPQRFSQQGLLKITPTQALKAMERVLRESIPQALAIQPDWDNLRSLLDGSASEALLPQRPRGKMAAKAPSVLSIADHRPAEIDVASAPEPERLGLVLDTAADLARRILGMPADQPLDPAQPLHEVGLDSLMAVELRNALNGAFGISLPPTALFDFPTLEALASHVVHGVLHLGGEGAPQAGQMQPSPDEQLESEVDQLSEDEAEALLMEELARMQGEPKV